nr:putative E3 ubiquitin-protein ligase RF298 isoform X1 [Ipomoea batatas]GMD72981.1 putative E3 ubiquitin-protein ligase RF298 isoform X1 [Ipomoea batatas]
MFKKANPKISQLVVWDDPMAVELEKLLIPLIKEASRTAIKKITECGCSEEEAEWAVLTSGIYQGYMDLINNIINGAFALLDTSIRSLFDDLESLAGYILLEMGVKPFLSSVGEDSMWLLLICDLNIYQAVADTQILMNQEISSTYKLWQLLALPLFQEIMLPVGNSVVSRTGIMVKLYLYTACCELQGSIRLKC